MLRLVYSNAFEELAAALSADLGAGGLDLFEQPPVVVPNRSVAAYVKLAVARRRGAAAGLRMTFLEAFIASLARPQAAVRLLDEARLEALLLAALADEARLAQPELKPVREYLSAGIELEDRELRRVQLARNLARIFHDYLDFRPELLEAWSSRLELGDSQLAQVEVWQRALYLAILGPGGLSAQRQAETGERWLAASSLLGALDPADLALPRRAFVIGFSYLAPVYQRILAQLAGELELHVYALNPCMEFWEDVRSEWEEERLRRRLARRGEANASDDVDTPALRLWGRPGRETVRLLNQLTDCDFEPRFVDPLQRGDSALTRLQRHILFREPQKPIPADDSITVHACSGVQRELELIASEIWRRMQRDPTLRFCDVALYVSRSEHDLYQAHLPAVFGAFHQLPFHVVDLPLERGRRMVEALELLLALPLGQFSRPEMLAILCHPAVISRFADVDPSHWVQWSERLDIYYGADADDHTGGYHTGEKFHWDQGILRLAFGAFMAAERSGLARTVVLDGRHYLPEEVPPAQLPSAARFAVLARSLISDARFLRAQKLSLTEWRALLDTVATTYLAADDDEAAAGLARCRTAIDSLAAADVDGRPVGYRIASELLRERLAGLRSAAGELLAEGVMVAPLLPMRPLPFRVIFACGLGEGVFPAIERESPLDLRAAQRRAGDLTPAERDRYLFLETLLSARDALILSYVARDSQTGDALEPSPVISELLAMLGESAIIHHPLRQYDEPVQQALSDVSEAAARQRLAAALREQLEHHLTTQSMAMPSYDALRSALQRPAFADVRQLVGLVDVEELAVPEPPPALTLPLSALRKFLESPLQAWASWVLRLREGDLEDLASRQDEAFATEFLREVSFLRELFAQHLLASPGDREALDRLYRERATLHERGRGAPTGLFAEVERQRHLARLYAWHEQLESVVGSSSLQFHRPTFGHGREHAAAATLLEPIELNCQLAGASAATRVSLTGGVSVVGGGAGTVVMATRKPEPKHAIRGAFDHVVLCAAGQLAPEPHLVTVLSDESVEQHRFQRWQPEEARDYLAMLATELLGSTHEYLLPIEVVLKWEKGRGSSLRADIAAVASSQQRCSDDYGPVSRRDQLQPPRDAEEMALRRLEPILQRWSKERHG